MGLCYRPNTINIRSWNTNENDGYNGICDPFSQEEFAYAPITVVGTQKIQYKGPNNDSYADVSSTLFVLKDTQVSFKAIPSGGSSFPNGKPVWSGSSGASGTGDTISISFSTLSSNTSDFKTVIATSGSSSAVVNVIVFSLTGTLNPQAFFTGRSNDRYGLKEAVNLGFIASPAVSSQQMGSLNWSISEGQGSVTNNTNLNGAGVFNASDQSGEVKLFLRIENGPSKGLGFLTDTLTVVAPSGAYIVKNGEVPVLHCQNYSSAGFQGFVYLTPKDVSFENLFFKEGHGIIQAPPGFYHNQHGLDHDPTDVGLQISTPSDASTGSLAFYDTIYTLNWTGPFSSGTLSWPIEWKYGFSATDPISSYVYFTDGVHAASADGQGAASISKANSGTFTKSVSDATSGTSSLDPCSAFPVLSP